MKIKVVSLVLVILLLKISLVSMAGNPPSHQLWNELLTKYVNSIGLVNYDGIINEKDKFESYLSLITTSKPDDSWGRDNLMAFWINAYNAFTIKLIIENYPLNSITDLKFEGKSAWDYSFIIIDGNQLTLNQIEHNILREKYADPRIHFAVNCASFSCPRLLNKAYNGESLNATLNKMTKDFINDPKYNKITREQVQVSQLFSWYKEDFTKQGSIINFLNKYSDITINNDAQITNNEYNWNLNSQK